MPKVKSPSEQQDTCWFCDQPADDSIPDRLGALDQFIEKSGGTETTIHYHSLCGAYGMLCRKRDTTNPNLVKMDVVQCRNYGSRTTCVLCGKQNTNVSCAYGGTCGKWYHATCARLAAMDATNPDRPVFEAEEKSRLIACAEHAEKLTNKVPEPAGPWLEAIGGWNRKSEAAKTHWIEQGEKKLRNGGQEENSDEEGDAKTEVQKEEDVEGGIESQLQNIDQGGYIVDETKLKLDQFQETFHIEGYKWLDEPCVDDCLPPLRVGERRFLGVTLSPPVAKEFEYVQQQFNDQVKKGKKLRQVVIVHRFGVDDPFVKKNKKAKKEPLDTFARRIEDKIVEHAKRIGQARKSAKSLEEIAELPADLPVSPFIECFNISPDDPRRGLASTPGALGVRVKRTATQNLPMGTLLGLYGGIQVFYEDYYRLTTDAKLAEALNMRVSELALQVDSYTADEDQFPFSGVQSGPVVPVDPDDDLGGGEWAWPIPEAGILKTHLKKRLAETCWLCTSSHLYGNAMCIINDPALDPFDSEGKKYEVDSEGWPFTAVITSKEVEKGEELLTSYEEGFWRNLQEKIRIADAQKIEQQKQQEKHEAEKERLRKKNEEAAAQLAHLRQEMERLKSANLGSTLVTSSRADQPINNDQAAGAGQNVTSPSAVNDGKGLKLPLSKPGKALDSAGSGVVQEGPTTSTGLKEAIARPPSSDRHNFSEAGPGDRPVRSTAGREGSPSRGGVSHRDREYTRDTHSRGRPGGSEGGGKDRSRDRDRDRDKERDRDRERSYHGGGSKRDDGRPPYRSHGSPPLASRGRGGSRGGRDSSYDGDGGFRGGKRGGRASRGRGRGRRGSTPPYSSGGRTSWDYRDEPSYGRGRGRFSTSPPRGGGGGRHRHDRSRSHSRDPHRRRSKSPGRDRSPLQGQVPHDRRRPASPSRPRTSPHPRDRELTDRGLVQDRINEYLSEKKDGDWTNVPKDPAPKRQRETDGPTVGFELRPSRAVTPSIDIEAEDEDPPWKKHRFVDPSKNGSCGKNGLVNVIASAPICKKGVSPAAPALGPRNESRSLESGELKVDIKPSETIKALKQAEKTHGSRKDAVVPSVAAGLQPPPPGSPPSNPLIQQRQQQQQQVNDSEWNQYVMPPLGPNEKR